MSEAAPFRPPVRPVRGMGASLAVVAAILRIVLIRRLTALQEWYLPSRSDAQAALAPEG